MDNRKTSVEISIVIPAFNEEGSLSLLYEKLINVLENTGKSFEIVFIDDGSTDSTLSIMKSIEDSDNRIQICSFKMNKGKAEGLQQGFLMANGKVIFTMDADLQDDPEEIPQFLRKLEEGYDLVSGWKIIRHDPLSKTIPSRLFNYVTSLAIGIRLHDFNCGFKAYRREVLDEIEIYGDLHRYIPALAHRKGFRITEIPVQHHSRIFGKSKYGIERFTRGFADLTTVLFLTKYLSSPMKLFGMAGLFMALCGVMIIIFLTVIQIIFGSILGHKPLSVLGVLLILSGMQFISMGLLGEIISKYAWRVEIGKPSIKNNLGTQNTKLSPVLSVVIPVYNEAKGLQRLMNSLVAVLLDFGKSFEIIIVDDGSTDNSFDVMKSLNKAHDAISVVQHRRKFGKAAALQSGFEATSGQYIATMDADFQDDPRNILKLFEKIEDGYDFINAKRIKVPFPRNLTSMAFNRIASVFLGINIPDMNSGLKLFKTEILKNITLYGELQRFMPALVAANGYRTTFLEVTHRERKYGSSKYGWNRIPLGFLNILTVSITTKYLRRPLHLFGNVGILVGGIGLIVNGYLAVLRFSKGSIQGHNTLLLVSTMLIILGIQLWSTGLVAELLNMAFYKRFDKKFL